MLDGARAASFVPGSNLRREKAYANWRFLLPRLEFERAFCIGAPEPATLVALRGFSREVTVLASPRRLERLRRRADVDGSVRLVASGATGAPALPPASADLFLVAGGDGLRILRRAPGGAGAGLERALARTGVVYIEARGVIESTLKRELEERLGRAVRLWLWPGADEIKAAAPFEHGEAIRLLTISGEAGPSARRPIVRAARRATGLARGLRSWKGREGLLAARGDALGPPPRYIRAVAEAQGVPLDAHRWGVRAPGEYLSRKLVFFLVEPDGRLEYVVKLVRDRSLNNRLATERRALELLEQEGIGDPETLPRVAFHGQVAGLALLGETAVRGDRFRARSSATAECAYARAAIDWLIELGAATADREATSPAEVAAALGGLLDRFVQLYRPVPEHERFLRQQIESLAASGRSLPTVLQHGDPTTWNLLITPAGRIALLDWESADPEGIPLWDLFYFMQGFGQLVSQAAGRHDRARSFADHYLADSELARLQADAVGRCCERVDVAGDLVEPLFYTCWIHRALKEATRLRAEDLGHGRYVALLRRCIDLRDAPGLRRLFGAGRLA